MDEQTSGQWVNVQMCMHRCCTAWDARWRVRWQSQQHGLERYNCADSLDRTNAASYFGAVQVHPATPHATVAVQQQHKQTCSAPCIRLHLRLGLVSLHACIRLLLFAHSVSEMCLHVSIMSAIRHAKSAYSQTAGYEHHSFHEAK